MTFEVLLSCMHKNDFNIITDSNLNEVKTLIINQCDVKEDYLEELDEKHRVIWTKTRGLSVSRNLAVKNASSDICLISDDDEVFCDELEKKVISAYESIPDADVIIFKMIDMPEKFKGCKKRLKKLDLLKVASWQISFRLDSIKDKLSFDTLLGAGTGNGGGEENKFLLDCYKNGLKIYYYPTEIATVAQDCSTWFFGYDDEYFYKRGCSTRYTYGFWFSLIYAFYFAIVKYEIYKKECSFFRALVCMLKGIKENDISKQKKRTKKIR